jgi:hypothetical protein
VKPPLDGHTLQALTNLRASPDFGRVLEWLKQYEAKETQTCVDGDGGVLQRAQGAVKTLQAIREAYDDAPNQLNKLKSKL